MHEVDEVNYICTSKVMCNSIRRVTEIFSYTLQGHPFMYVFYLLDVFNILCGNILRDQQLDYIQEIVRSKKLVHLQSHIVHVHVYLDFKVFSPTEKKDETLTSRKLAPN